MLIEIFIAAARSVPDEADVSTAPERAKSNLEEGLIRRLFSWITGFRAPKKREKDRSIGIAGGDLTGHFGTLGEIAADGEVGGRRAGAIALLKRAIAAVEACDHQIAPLSGRRFGVDERLCLVAPLLAFVGAAYPTQKMQRAENLRKPLQVAIVGSGRILRRGSGLGLRLTRLARLTGPRLQLRGWRRKRPKLGLRLKRGLRTGCLQRLRLSKRLSKICAPVGPAPRDNKSKTMMEVRTIGFV